MKWQTITCCGMTWTSTEDNVKCRKSGIVKIVNQEVRYEKVNKETYLPKATEAKTRSHEENSRRR